MAANQPNPNRIYPPDNSWAVRLNRWTLSASRHWLQTILVFLGLYGFMPLAAPVLMHLGATGPAMAIYNFYSPLCHQFAFRSFFFFGEQVVYPREAANVPDLRPYEYFEPQIQKELPANRVTPPGLPPEQSDAKLFVGDPQMGYKVAICQRDVGIYLALFFSGLIFSIRKIRIHLRPPPLWLYLLIGIVPIGIDGFSQLLSQPPFNLFPLRETSPWFRIITGALFGLANGWFAFTYMESAARDTIREIEEKFARRAARQQATG